MEPSALFAYLSRLPLFLVWLIGVIVALKQRRQHPEVSQLVLVALAILLVGHAIDNALSPNLAEFARAQDWGAQGFGLAVFIKGILLTFLTAIAWALVIRAALTNREPEGLP